MNVWDLIEKSMTDFCSALQFSSLDKHFNRTVYFLAKKSINRLKLNPIPIKFGSKTIASAMAFPTPFFISLATLKSVKSFCFLISLNILSIRAITSVVLLQHFRNGSRIILRSSSDWFLPDWWCLSLNSLGCLLVINMAGKMLSPFSPFIWCHDSTSSSKCSWVPLMTTALFSAAIAAILS